MSTSDTLPVVVVVSGDSYKAAFFKRTLKGLFQVIDVSDPFGAVDWLKSVQATLIILDEKTLTNSWGMVAEHIRKLPGYRDIPILLITNNLKKSFLVTALNMGISDFLNEPFDTDEIFQRILVATQSKPVTKKVSMMTKKFKKTLSAPGAKLASPQRFVITKEAMKEIALVQEKHQSLCLLLLEVDDFQKISSDIGEEGVQKMSSHFNHLFKAHKRPSDIVFPQGNGRFLMLLPDTSHRAAMTIAETLRKEIQAKPFHFESHSILLSLSIGVVALDKNTAFSQGDLLGKVGKALKRKEGSE